MVDDGSTDSTRQMVAQRFPATIYLYQPNQGVSCARNAGIGAASGEWIALLDSDDEWLPRKLAAQMNLLSQQPEHLLCHTEEIWIRNGKQVNQMKKHTKCGGEIFQRCLSLCIISPSSVLIHRSLFERIGLFDESLPACEDYDLWLRICASHPVAYVATPQIVKHGGHSDQLSRQHWGMDRFRLKALVKIIESGALSGADLSAARAMLRKKAAILANGAEKRGNRNAAVEYRTLAEQHLDPAGKGNHRHRNADESVEVMDSILNAHAIDSNQPLGVFFRDV